jgi:hypothetical protein
MKVGDLVRRKNYNPDPNKIGIIVVVYDSKVKTTVSVKWFDEDYNGDLAIEPYFLEKVC